MQLTFVSIAVVLTFAGGPYSTLGNAYFGTWGAFSSAAGLTVLRMADSGRSTHTRIPDCPVTHQLAVGDFAHHRLSDSNGQQS